ncbi:FMN-dependent NADH-azoreductase [Sinorhizobium kostiense]|uniref:FMN dependent NADH:quinone oxidoreductase n=1 Tax=Sinorhizobium kostiense TaxID=76747 RepID=A0ABS4R2P9_9HYPH|nr:MULTISPECIES: NAD(P)H-dependent oxidoreductase [Sinorhizobium]MBP2236564.1 FMN-dependent NADH-azoreductase [Sinorhizobium kostiense]
MTNILLITSSPRGPQSLSTRFARDIAESLSARSGGAIIERDLGAVPLPHVTAAYIDGRIAPPEARTPEQIEAVDLAQSLVDEIQAADVIVIGWGMINFGPPTQLKAWFDYITWPGVTFRYDATGPMGLLPSKKVYLVTATGGVFSEGRNAPFDFQTGYLTHLLGFIGLRDIEVIRVEGTLMSPDRAMAAIASTEATIRAALERAA